jgi:hypothetical protein
VVICRPNLAIEELSLRDCQCIAIRVSNDVGSDRAVPSFTGLDMPDDEGAVALTSDVHDGTPTTYCMQR